MEGTKDSLQELQRPPSPKPSVSKGPLPSPLINFDPAITPNIPSLAQCIFCDERFPLDEDGKDVLLLQHMFFQHRLVVADSQHIAGLSSYCDYWKARLSNNPPAEFFFGINVDPKPTDANPNISGSYFLLSDQLPEDRTLREGLQKKRLEWALQWQQWERSDETFERTCLFCKESFSGKGARSALLGHLSMNHNLQLGHPHNLVFIDVLLDKLQSTMNKMLCIYCGKKFTDWFVLKEHMRKKQHKRVNPKDPTFDRFYIVNYLERGKGWQDIQCEHDVDDEHGGGASSEGEGTSNDPCGDWSDWEEEGVGDESQVQCLFCTFKGTDLVSVIAHMREEHCGFDLLTFDDRRFYSLVKIVNYIRRRVQEGRCIVCDWRVEEEVVEDKESSGDMRSLRKKKESTGSVPSLVEKKIDSEMREALLKHMTELGHYACPEPKLWDWPEYFFPTYENDALLYVLGELCDEEGEEETQQEMIQNMMGLLSCESSDQQDQACNEVSQNH